MTWRGLMVAGLLVLLSFSVSIAHARDPFNRDPFASIGVPVPEKPQPGAAAAPVKKPAPRRPVTRRPAVVAPATVQYNDKPFVLWLDEFKTEAANKGIRQNVIDDAFRNIQPNDTVVRLDRQQPENKISWTQYEGSAVNARRLAKGHELLLENLSLLKKIEAQYHVPPQIIIALWGIETEFGANKGNFSLIQSLTTLAYEGRRAEFFRAELINALKIMQDENVMGGTLTGSWAGAMGHCQFMPSTYLAHAVDWNRDGHRDIWNSTEDTLASIASYLHASGWDDSLPWGMKVTLPANFPEKDADLYKAQPLKHWRDRGVATADGKRLPGGDSTKMYLMFPGTPDEEAYLVSDNYHVLLEWNRSRYFATSVGLISDGIK